MDLTKNVVKIKKLQKVGDGSLCVIIPKNWINDMNWNQDTKFILEFLPHRKMMILSEEKIFLKKITKEIVESAHGEKDGCVITG